MKSYKREATTQGQVTTNNTVGPWEENKGRRDHTWKKAWDMLVQVSSQEKQDAPLIELIFQRCDTE